MKRTSMVRTTLLSFCLLAGSVSEGRISGVSALRGGGDGLDEARCVAAGGLDGGIVVAGRFTASGAMGFPAVAPAGAEDGFIAKFDFNGASEWTRNIGGSGYDVVNACVANAAGEVIITGSFMGSIDFGSGTHTMDSDATGIYVVKLSSLGQTLWSVAYGGSGFSNAGHAIAIGPEGDIMVSGAFEGTVDFGGHILSSHGASDILVLSLDQEGHTRWATSFGGSSAAYGNSGLGMDVDADGNVVVAGFYSGEMTIGETFHRIGADARGIVVLSLDRGGNVRWSQSFGNEGDNVAFAVATERNGDAIVTGWFSGSIRFECDVVEAVGDVDAFLLKLDGITGEPAWIRQMGGDGFDAGGDVALDASGHVIVVGAFSGAAMVGPAPLMSAGERDAFVAEYDNHGRWLWAETMGGPGNDAGQAVVVRFNKRVVVVGAFEDSAQFGSETLVSAGGPDLFRVEFVRSPGFSDVGAAFVRGDCGQDGVVSIVDVLSSLRVLIGIKDTQCRAACDANGDDTHTIEDALFLLDYIVGAAPPPLPFPMPGRAEYLNRALVCDAGIELRDGAEFESSIEVSGVCHMGESLIAVGDEGEIVIYDDTGNLLDGVDTDLNLEDIVCIGEDIILLEEGDRGNKEGKGARWSKLHYLTLDALHDRSRWRTSTIKGPVGRQLEQMEGVTVGAGLLYLLAQESAEVFAIPIPTPGNDIDLTGVSPLLELRMLERGQPQGRSIAFSDVGARVVVLLQTPTSDGVIWEFRHDDAGHLIPHAYVALRNGDGQWEGLALSDCDEVACAITLGLDRGDSGGVVFKLEASKPVES